MVHLKGYSVSHDHRVASYRQYEEEFQLKFTGLEFPIQLNDIPKFEKLNNVSINLYVLEKEKKGRDYEIYPIHLTSNRKDESRHIRLLLLQKKFIPPELERNVIDEEILIPKRRK